MVKAIVGANWGDEGKGKITDMFADNSDVVVRFQGGTNAGHTIINDYGKFALHTLPSGIFHSNITNIVGNGVALDVDKLINEISEVRKGAPTLKFNLRVSDRAQLMMPYHVLLDTYEEARLKDKQFGSTKSGIAPFYADKYSKIGFQVCELWAPETLHEKLTRIMEVKNLLITQLYHQQPLDVEAVYAKMLEWRQMLAPYVCDTGELLRAAVDAGKRVLLEGQLGALKDPDFGIYPFVTSSSPVAGYAAIGAGGIPPYSINEIVAVTKAYSSAVGAGSFVSEIFGEEADKLRHLGGDAGEFGATTGRPRRMGWFDVVATRYGARVQGATSLALTAVDVLGYLDEIPVCVGYDIDGEYTESFPNQLNIDKAKPVLKKLPGWKSDIRGITDYAALPQQVKDYVRFVEQSVGVPVSILSTGPKRGDVIFLK